MKTKQHIITKIHLIISVLIVVPVSFVYGFNPSSEFDIHLNTVDEHNFFKAIMGLYLGFSILWLLGIFRASFLKMALVSNIIFMLGLGSGRLLSLFMDGTPPFGYQFGTFAELFLGFYGLLVFNLRYNKSTSVS
jgi:hypothetical protein